MLAPDGYIPLHPPPPENPNRLQVKTYIERAEEMERNGGGGVIIKGTGASGRVNTLTINTVKGPPPRMIPSKVFDPSGDPRIAVLNQEKRSQSDLETFYEWSRSFAFFTGMSKSIHMEIIQRAQLIQVAKKHQVVYMTGDEPTGLYVVLSGTLGIYKEPDDLRPGWHSNYARIEPETMVAKGERVGEREMGAEETPLGRFAEAAGKIAVSLEDPSKVKPVNQPSKLREYTVATTTDAVSLLFITKQDYLQLKTLNRENLIYDIISFLKHVSIFRHWSDAALGQLAPLFQVRTFMEPNTTGKGANAAGTGGSPSISMSMVNSSTAAAAALNSDVSSRSSLGSGRRREFG